jgi:hypothetical protein
MRPSITGKRVGVEKSVVPPTVPHLATPARGHGGIEHRMPSVGEHRKGRNIRRGASGIFIRRGQGCRF